MPALPPSLSRLIRTAPLLVLGSAAPLAVALVAQFFFALPPCHFCLLQRYPYLVAIVAGLVLWRLPRYRGLLVAVGVLALLTTGALGAYHTSIERGWIAYSGGCVADAGATGSIDDLRAQILNAPKVSCTDAMASFAGLSMASWNMLYAWGLAMIIAVLYLRERRSIRHAIHRET